MIDSAPSGLPGALVLVAIAVPFLIPCFVPILAVFWWVRRRYVTTSREIKRFEGTTRSPVYSSFSAAVKVGSLKCAHTMLNKAHIPGANCPAGMGYTASIG